MADPSEKSLLGSPHQHRPATNTDQVFHCLSPSKLAGESLAPLRQYRKTEAHTNPVKDEFGLAVA
jgi:hypothetical protein